MFLFLLYTFYTSFRVSYNFGKVKQCHDQLTLLAVRYPSPPIILVFSMRESIVPEVLINVQSK